MGDELCNMNNFYTLVDHVSEKQLLNPRVKITIK